MTNFTRTADPEVNNIVNKKIQHDLDYICRKVKRLLGKNLHSILLCGGFGRGEGSVTISNCNVHIVNDYDFTIVLNTFSKIKYLRLYHQYHLPLETLAKELADTLDIKQVDLSPKPLSYFKDKTLKIENYEVKKGHILIYGNADPTHLMPDWKSSNIPLFEGTWLFRNRGLGLILAALYFIDSPIAHENKENFIIECTKAQMAIGDAALLSVGRYHHLYHRRLKITKTSGFSNIPNAEYLKASYTTALIQKLTPDFSQFENLDYKEYWYNTKDTFLSFFKFYEQKRLNQEFAEWSEYAQLKKTEDKIDLKRFAGNLIRTMKSNISLNGAKTNIQKSRSSYSVALVALTLAAFKRNGFDEKPMLKAAELLNLEIPKDLKKSWIILAIATLEEIHPGGEVGKVVKTYKEKYVC